MNTGRNSKQPASAGTLGKRRLLVGSAASCVANPGFPFQNVLSVKSLVWVSGAGIAQWLERRTRD